MAQELKVHSANEQGSDRSAPLQRGRMTPALSPFDEIERLFDELLPAPMLRFGRTPLARGLMDSQSRMPRVDVVERDNEIVVHAEVPGVRKQDLDISVDENSVTIRGTLSHDQEQAQGDFYRREISRGEFARSVALPGAIDSDKAKASLKDGVLELVLPKLEGSKRRKIEIK